MKKMHEHIKKTAKKKNAGVIRIIGFKITQMRISSLVVMLLPL